ncbi:transposase [Dyella koreensis]
MGTWGDAQVLCWIFMPDHWHGLVQLGANDDISLVMNRFKAVTTKRLRADFPRQVWARGFHDHALRRDEGVITAAQLHHSQPPASRLSRQHTRLPVLEQRLAVGALLVGYKPAGLPICTAKPPEGRGPGGLE